MHASLEHDLHLITNEKLSWEMKMSVVYRIEKKKILRSQQNVICYLLRLVNETIKLKS